MRRSPVSVVLLPLVLAPALLLALVALATPAEAAHRRTATTVTGWSASPATVATGAIYAPKIRVTGGARTVVLEKRTGTSWHSVDVARSARTGGATLTWTAPAEATSVALRVRVPATPTYAAATTVARTVTVQAPTPTQPTEPTEPTTPTTPTTPSQPTTPTTPTYTAAQTEVLRLVNAARASGATCGGVAYAPVAPLTAEVRLTRAADKYAARMASEGFFAHTAPDGSTPSARIEAEGYTWRTWGENIAAGYADPAAVVQGWLASAGHCKNIMNGAFTQLGVGYTANPASAYRHYWVQNFGTPR